MANRPVYIAKEIQPYFECVDTEFKFYSGFSLKQKHLSIKSLHAAFNEIYPDKKVLEISSKSDNDLGVKVSAFNLQFSYKDLDKVFSVESAFQGSKVFENGGPYVDLLGKSSRDAKHDERIKTSGRLIAFKFFGEVFPVDPKTYFYDWLYINALNFNSDLAAEILNCDAFTDIEFNPKKSLNCQAAAAAIFVGLSRADLLSAALKNKEDFLEIVYPKKIAAELRGNIFIY
ncbi:MAG: hypothetical protein IJU91_07355 [Selenomonadaceae bacterium]|nr:hypothetical protein [Selenomonadaceae bacterium]